MSEYEGKWGGSIPKLPDAPDARHAEANQPSREISYVDEILEEAFQNGEFDAEASQSAPEPIKRYRVLVFKGGDEIQAYEHPEGSFVLYRDHAAYAAHVAAPLEAEIACLKDELQRIDNTLARRPAVVGLDRDVAIERACSMAGRAESAEQGKAEALALTAQTLENAKAQGLALVLTSADAYDFKNVRAEAAEAENTALKARIVELEKALHEIVDTLSPDDFAHWTQMARAALAGKGGQ